ncbi:S24 family peptidase [Sphingobium sp. AN558]|uniref:S24 family peptidase n=1 Tax=Sphingobium sp. AN558 TaxID=3133442 RepID=UPI0030BFBE15
MPADIFRRLDASGRKQRELASVLGIDENKISKAKIGERQFQAQEVLKAHEWLNSIEAGEDVRASYEPDPDEVEIQEWHFAYGMGGGTYLDIPVTGETHKFSRSWLRRFTNAPPEKIFLASGTGDSMMPTILETDVVIIDTSEREVRVGDKIWALAIGEVGYIKRLRPRADGSVTILSDNPNVPDDSASDGEMSIVGRVVAIVRKT